jgi:hypothetical protein
VFLLAASSTGPVNMAAGAFAPAVSVRADAGLAARVSFGDATFAAVPG